MPQIDVRPAQAEDHDSVLAFCSKTWEWREDYIGRVWDIWLHDPDGCLFVATLDGRPVGVAHMRMLSSTDAWLEGVRVDPGYRRRGIATALNRAMLVEAMQRGATVARLIVEAENVPSIELFEHKHMHKVGVFAIYTAPPLGTSSQKRSVQEKTQLATSDDLDDIINFLNVSNIMPAVGGLYYVGWKARSITAELLEARIADQNVYLLRRWDRLDGLAITEPREGLIGKCLSLGYIDGTAIEAISLIAYDLRSRLSELGLEVVQAFVPNLVLVHDALNGIGYESDRALYYTYERSLT